MSFDVASSAQTTNSATLSWSHTCTGSNLVLFVGAASSDATAGNTTGVTYNAVAMTEKWDGTGPNASFHQSGHILVAPTTGAHTIQITISTADSEFGGVAQSWTNINQSVPTGSPPAIASGGSTTPSCNVTAVVGDPVVDVVYVEKTSITSVGSGQTLPTNGKSENIGAATSIGTSYEVAGSTTVTMDWTIASANWNSCGIALKPLASSTLEQEGYRWRNDDGDETTATWNMAQDNEGTFTANSSKRLRVIVDATGDPAAIAPQLEYRKIGDSVWRKVP